jgi:hypothetical protein
METKKYELDISFETLSFEETIETLKKSVKEIKVLEVVKEGRGSGWPTILVELPVKSMDNLKTWYEGVEDVLDCEIQDDDWRSWER